MVKAITPESIVKAIWPDVAGEAIREVLEVAGSGPRRLDNIIDIATAANRRYQENLQAQRDGTANALGLARPEGWTARYDGDY